jgi:hypothetical protein
MATQAGIEQVQGQQTRPHPLALLRPFEQCMRSRVSGRSDCLGKFIHESGQASDILGCRAVATAEFD